MGDLRCMHLGKFVVVPKSSSCVTNKDFCAQFTTSSSEAAKDRLLNWSLVLILYLRLLWTKEGRMATAISNGRRTKSNLG